MSAVQTPARADGAERNGQTRTRPVRRLATETKQAFKTSEFWAMVGLIVAILVSAAVINGGDNGTDEFIAYVAMVAGVLIAAAVVDEADGGGLGAKQAWLYVTILTVGYMVSRGLAKAGSRQPYDEDRS